MIGLESEQNDDKSREVLCRKGEYREGIQELEIQAALLEERPWIEKWGWLILPRLRAYSYKEWALLRIANAYIQLGEGDRLLPLSEQILALNPKNGLAATNIKFINLFRGEEGSG